MSEPQSFFARLDDDRRAALIGLGTSRRFARGEALMYRGQAADGVLLLRSGRVKVTAPTSQGRDVVLAFRGPGELLGELGSLDRSPRMATVTAVDDVVAAVIPLAAFRAFLAREPDVAFALLVELSARLRDADAKRIDFAALDTLGRVAARLLELAERFGEETGDGVEISLPVTQEELAGWCGASLEATGKALAAMRKLGWVETRRRSLTVRDADALRAAT